MKTPRINSKRTFALWIVSYIIACIAGNVLIEQKTRTLPIGNSYMEIATPKSAMLITALIVVWFLPLAVVTYRSAKETNKIIRFISGCIIFWLGISLLACAFILVCGG